MVPAGLIVSELVTNCLKHGFKGRSHGHIAISLRQTPELNECVLTVSNDGCSNAGSSDSKAGLGKIIVNGLAAQLRAKISCERGVAPR
jgi:two-component sensor histidine kinase